MFSSFLPKLPNGPSNQQKIMPFQSEAELFGVDSQQNSSKDKDNDKDSNKKQKPSSRIEQLLQDMGKQDNVLKEIYKMHNHKDILRINLSFDMPPGELGYTNSVLIGTDGEQDVEVFLPGYLRMKILNMQSLQIMQRMSIMNSVIEFSICFGTLPTMLLEYLKRRFVMRFSKSHSIRLKQDEDDDYSVKVKEDDKLKLLTFTIRKPITFNFEPYYPFEGVPIDFSIWLSPYEKIINSLTISIEELILKVDDIKVEAKKYGRLNEFKEIIDFFKKIKKYEKSKKFRNFIFKVNLMDLEDADDEEKEAENNQNNRDIVEAFKRLANRPSLLEKIWPDQREDAKNVRETVQDLINLNKCKKELRDENLKHCSANQFTYETEGLSGQYDIIVPKMKVEYSCFKFKEMNQMILDEAAFAGIPEGRIYNRDSLHAHPLCDKILQAIAKIRDEYKVGVSSVKKMKEHILKNKDLSKNQAPEDFLSNIFNAYKVRKQGSFQGEPSNKLVPENSLNNLDDTMRPHQASTDRSDVLLFSRKSMEVSSAEVVQDASAKRDAIETDKLLDTLAEEIKKEEDKAENFKYAHFTLPIYKHPFVPLAIVFLPLFIISLINLVIFVSPRDMNDRVANISTLLIAYVAYFPIFRQQVPEYRYLLLAEIMAYLQIFCSLLALVHTVTYNEGDQEVDLAEMDVTFWIAFGITFLTVLLVVLSYVLYKIFVEHKYEGTKTDDEQKKQLIKSGGLFHIIWNNFECDLNFFLRDNYKRLSRLEEFKYKGDDSEY